MRRHGTRSELKTILMVDDEADLLSTVQPMLEAEGYRVETAKDGEEALRRIAARRPDLLLLDLEMPGIGGRQVCELLRGADATRWLPILVLTGRSDASEEIRCLEHGADDFVAKPFDGDELRARIQALLRRSALGRWRPQPAVNAN
ncbi:MAG: response regulator [Elusimicrobia bacterium]|nr:response regulator [Elusimicrobiota bacterium]